MKTKAFIRRVGFGLKPDEKVPENPLEWAKEQMQVAPKLIWPGRIYTEKEMLDIRLDFTAAEDKLQKTEKDPSKAKIKRKTEVKLQKNGTGTLIISFKNEDELEHIMQCFQKT